MKRQGIKLLGKCMFDKKECTACGACVNICPNDAIGFIEDEDTFLFPSIDEDKCCDCSLCEKVCPKINRLERNNRTAPQVAWFRGREEIRKHSSSGGVFSSLSEAMLTEGAVIFASGFENGIDTSVYEIDDVAMIEKCRGSIYFQINLGYTFRRIKETLSKHKRVVFFGLPCQIAGLQKYVGTENGNLFTVDLLCHGVPSEGMFKQYLSEISLGRDVNKVEFRNKKYGWRSDVLNIAFENGQSYTKSWRQGDSYEKAFQENLSLRDCCENCEFCGFPRVGDISIGDFCGINEFITDDRKGTSIILVNNDKGDELIRYLANVGDIGFLFDVDYSKIPNRIHPIYKHSSQKKLFRKLLKKHCFSESVSMALGKRHDVAIVGIPTVENFGGALTYYALYSFLENNGFDCALIDRPLDCKHPAGRTECIYNVSPYGDATLYNEVRFRNGLQEVSDIADVYVVGSDQLYHKNLLENFGFFPLLDWVEDNKKKIAYAASFGHEHFTGSEEMRAYVSYYLKKFDNMSFREKSGVELARKEFGVIGEYVLDPVFLCETGYYDKLIKNSRTDIDYDFFCCYILDPNAKKEKIIMDVREQCNSPFLAYSEMHYSNNSVKDKWNIDIQIGKIEDRLAAFRNSKLIVADSFHGVCMAIIFNIDFIAIANVNRGLTRFESLLGELGLMDRLIFEEDEFDRSILQKRIDYESVNRKLHSLKQRSAEWLLSNIQHNEPKSFSTEDIVRSQFANEISRINDSISEIMEYLGIGFSRCVDIYQYMTELVKHKDRLIIILVAKDTPGMALNDRIDYLMKQLGVQNEIKNKHWYSFFAIIYRGLNVAEECVYNKASSYNVIIEDNSIAVKSGPLHDGNIAYCAINGKDYAKNLRGINFVAFDLDRKCVVDSVSFDTHDYRFNCYR